MRLSSSPLTPRRETVSSGLDQLHELRDSLGETEKLEGAPFRCGTYVVKQKVGSRISCMQDPLPPDLSPRPSTNHPPFAPQKRLREERGTRSTAVISSQWSVVSEGKGGPPVLCPLPTDEGRLCGTAGYTQRAWSVSSKNSEVFAKAIT
jgi:hypothetical protein